MYLLEKESYVQLGKYIGHCGMCVGIVLKSLFSTYMLNLGKYLNDSHNQFIFYKAKLQKEDIFSSSIFFARHILLMKKLEIEETKTTYSVQLLQLM